MQTISIQTKKSENRLKSWIVQVITEILNDPDFGLELSENAKKRLRQKTIRTTPFTEIKKKYC